MGNSLNINEEGGDAGMSSVVQGKAKDKLRMTAGQIVDNLIDIVSKNGNMMLNVGLRPDGSLPETFRDELIKIGNWLKLNGEAIYDTRPFTVYGEGTFPPKPTNSSTRTIYIHSQPKTYASLPKRIQYMSLHWTGRETEKY